MRNINSFLIRVQTTYSRMLQSLQSSFLLPTFVQIHRLQLPTNYNLYFFFTFKHVILIYFQVASTCLKCKLQQTCIRNRNCDGEVWIVHPGNCCKTQWCKFLFDITLRTLMKRKLTWDLGLILFRKLCWSQMRSKTPCVSFWEATWKILIFAGSLLFCFDGVTKWWKLSFKTFSKTLVR